MIWFSRPANLMVLNLFWTFTGCHGNEIWDKLGYNSACVRVSCRMFAPIEGGGSGMDHRMLRIKFYSRPTLVAMATKFGTK